MKQQGGGNDPTCGCDMQAGWPSASQFPRGGLQGGGFDFNEFNLALTKNGKTRHLKGKWNTEMYENNQNKSVKKTSNKKRNKTNKKRGSSAPNGYSNLAYKGEKYLKNNTSGEVFEINENGARGNSIGFYVTPKSGKPYMTQYMTQMPPPLKTEQQMNRLSQPITPVTKSQSINYRTQLPPEPEIFNMAENYETEPPEGQTESRRSSLALNGGGRMTRKKYHKRRSTRRRRT
jgi:hypothetical protein